MTSLRKELTDLLTRFDDDAFAALANRGLLRRACKDLETQAATILEESPETLVIGFGGHRIRFDSRGPAHASCTCPAGNVCQHILAAAITLQRLGAVPETEGNSDGAATAGHAAEEEGPAENLTPGTTGAQLADLQAGLLAMTKNEMSAYCGKAGYRWAWQYVLDLDIEHGLRIAGDQHILIGFQHPRVTFRYMGGKLDNLIADSRIPSIEKYTVAAVLAYQKANGMMLAAPDPAGKSRTLILNLGQDFAEPESAAEAQHDSRRRLRATLRQVIAECLEIGLSHLSRGMFERFITLSIWAQGAEYYRLARLLRRIADHIEMLLERAGNADEHLLLDELTLAYGLVSALDDAAKQNTVPAHLAGKARDRYDTAGQLELFGLGAGAWRAQSGYVGLTVLFWAKSENSFLTYTDARPETQSSGFDPFARYSAPGPWSGLSSPSAATGCKILLSTARISETGRLSASGSSTATIASPFGSDEIIPHLKPHADWSDMIHVRRMARRSLLAKPDPLKDWAALQPKKFGRPRFDGNRQTLIWPLFDDQGQRIAAELQFSEYTRHAIMRIEQEADSLEAGTVVIGRIRNNPSGVVLEPLSLVKAGTDGNVVDALHFDDGRNTGGLSTLLSRLKASEASIDSITPMTILPGTLLEMGRWLRRTSERGAQEEIGGGYLNEFRALCEKAGSAGFTAFSQLLCEPRALPEILLKANYLRLQYERLIDDSQEQVL